MKRLLFCLIFAIYFPSHAQETNWPPDLRGVLGADIEIVSIETIDRNSVSNFEPRLDNAAREVSIYDEASATWFAFPYPEAVTSVWNIQQDGSELILTTTTRGVYGTEPEPSGLWILDLETGEYYRPELICGELAAGAGEGYWLIPLDAETPYLCNTETGETLPLPEDVEGLRNSYTVLKLSPDGTRGVLIGNDGFYVYSFADASLTYLGGETYYDIQSVWWMGNDWIMIMQTQMADMSFPWRYYYLANASEANSLESITTVLKPGYITQLENPARLEWVESREETCILVQMHYETGQRDEYPLASVCEQGYSISNSNERLAFPFILEEMERGCEDCPQYFRALGRRLVRFNPYTGEEVELMRGELEFLMDVTDDGRYAVLVLDDNGQIDMLDEWERYYILRGEGPFTGQLRYAILEIQTGEILYEVPTVASSGFDYWYDGVDDGRIIPDYSVWSSLAVAPNDSFYYIGDNRFIFSQRNPDFSTNQTLIQLYPAIEEIELGQAILILPDSRGIIQKVQNGETYQLELFNPEAGSRQVLLNTVDDTQYNDGSLSLNGQHFRVLRGDEADTIELSFFNQELQESIQYTLRISNLL